METIGVFLNGSEAAAASLEFGIKEAALRHARLRLISAWEVPQSMLGAGVGGKELYDQFRESAEALVEEGVARAAELAPTVECERRVVKASPTTCSSRSPKTAPSWWRPGVGRELCGRW